MSVAQIIRKKCACGQPLHYKSKQVQTMVQYLVEQYGETTVVQIGERAWKVPRHYIALHGLKAVDLPELAKKYNFEEI